ncbi:hypothetical protein [Wolbachia endosymbiont of Atemnus politus]|nr:hypothetical protein [Wolbachia endosymbiont of Atemnus politus]
MKTDKYVGTFGKRFAHSKNAEVSKIGQTLKSLSNRVFAVHKSKNKI